MKENNPGVIFYNFCHYLSPFSYLLLIKSSQGDIVIMSNGTHNVRSALKFSFLKCGGWENAGRPCLPCNWRFRFIVSHIANLQCCSAIYSVPKLIFLSLLPWQRKSLLKLQTSTSMGYENRHFHMGEDAHCSKQYCIDGKKKTTYQNREQNHVLDSPVLENNLRKQSYVIHFRIF